MTENEKTPAGGSQHDRLLADLRAAIVENTDGEQRERLLARLHDLENAANTPSFGDHVKSLIEEAEEDAAAIAPFMARLSSLLP